MKTTLTITNATMTAAQIRYDSMEPTHDPDYSDREVDALEALPASLREAADDLGLTIAAEWDPERGEADIYLVDGESRCPVDGDLDDIGEALGLLTGLPADWDIWAELLADVCAGRMSPSAVRSYMRGRWWHAQGQEVCPVEHAGTWARIGWEDADRNAEAKRIAV